MDSAGAGRKRNGGGCTIVLRRFVSIPTSRLATNLCGIALKNPVLAASGTFGYGIEFAHLLNLDELGGLVTKGISREPIAGNAAPRLWESEGGMLNSVGLQNVGVREFVAAKLPKLREHSVPVFVNVFGYASEDYAEVVRVLEDAEGIVAYELNVSCPNVKQGGIYFSSDPSCLASLMGGVRPLAKRPLIVKLSPNVSAIEPLAKAAEDAGADAISLVNTFRAMAIDAKTAKPRLGAGFGGLSGPAIKPIALRFVYEAAQAVRVPIIGMGGIANGTDAAEFLIAGAQAVEVGTATFWNPRAPLEIAKGLDRFLRKKRLSNVRELVGTLQFEN